MDIDVDPEQFKLGLKSKYGEMLQKPLACRSTPNCLRRGWVCLRPSQKVRSQNFATAVPHMAFAAADVAPVSGVSTLLQQGQPAWTSPASARWQASWASLASL